MDTNLNKKNTELWNNFFQILLERLNPILPGNGGSSPIEHIFKLNFTRDEEHEIDFSDLDTIMGFYIWKSNGNNQTDYLEFTFKNKNRVLIKPNCGDNLTHGWEEFEINESKTITWNEAYNLLNSMIQSLTILPPVPN